VARRPDRGRLTIITDAELANIAGMARSLAAHPLVKAGILDGAVERSLIWRDPETGDVVQEPARRDPQHSPATFADLKTCVSVSTDALRRSLADFGYHQQGALVGEASATSSAARCRPSPSSGSRRKRPGACASPPSRLRI
jgi:hypothetical protein